MKNNKWISVKDKLPELEIEFNDCKESKDCLVVCDDRILIAELSIYEDDEDGTLPQWNTTCEERYNITDEVTHWMYLPELPQTEV